MALSNEFLNHSRVDLGTTRRNSLRTQFKGFLSTNPIVTKSGSRFKETKWNLSSDTKRRMTRSDAEIDFSLNPVLGTEKTHHWLPQGKSLYDYPELYNAAKTLFAAFQFLPRNRAGNQYSVASLKTIWVGFRALCAVLVENGVYSLSAIDDLAWTRIGAARGNVSRSIDVVVFDRQYTPTLLDNDKHRYVPAEAVYAVFECKPKIDKGYLEYAADMAQSVRRLPAGSVLTCAHDRQLPFLAPRRNISQAAIPSWR